MIEIEYEDFRLTVKGHANSAEVGKDIICASVSILTYTLCENLQFKDTMLEDDSLQINLESGDADISCKPKESYKGNISIVFSTILRGFGLLAEGYPDYVKLSVK